MKILLISPGSQDDIDSRIIREIPYLFSKAFFAPHAVAAVAALTPREHEVEIHDEYMRGPVDAVVQNNTYDLIGISITSNQFKRCLHIAELCKKYHSTTMVVAGGIGVENLVYKSKHVFDVVFHGEVEDTWPVFLEDLKKGSYKRIYKNMSKPDMTKTPAPRWDLIAKDIKFYNAVSVQTTRGCPFDCSFCDVIYTYGRKPRSKTIEQVLEEIKKLNELNVKMVFIADDNFTGDKNYAKELLRKLAPLNNSFKSPMGFLTQLDITIANDDELLMLLANSNFYAVMIGIESVNEDSLKEMNKQQNLRISIVDAVHKIQSYGIIVLAHMIIGADSDDDTVYKKTADFVTEANIVLHNCHPLTAPPGTKMWYDLKRQGRIISPGEDEISDKHDIITNIVPKQMTRIELLNGLADYWEDIYDPQKFMERANAFIRGIKKKPEVKAPGIHGLWKMRRMLGAVMKFYISSVTKEQRKAFFTTIRMARQKVSYLMPKIIYSYTFYLMDYKRSMYDAKIAREHAQWEKDNPHKVTVDTCALPVSGKIRENAKLIFAAAYQRVRKEISKKEILYKIVVAAVLDFNDRFGETFDAFDEFHNEQINNSCDRILHQYMDTPADLKGDLPVNPPSGYTREMMDALDNAARYRNMY